MAAVAQRAGSDVDVVDAPKVRVRFAPSPTGVLHVGGLRTALFNWLFAQSEGGELVLRVEDTDQARSTAESEEAILESLKWSGITWDEGPDIGGSSGPYRQSERIAAGIYQQWLDTLLATGKAYRCFLTSEELEAMREEAEQKGQAFIIHSPWARASEQDIQEKLDMGAPFVYRFRVPEGERLVVNDLVLGEVSWSSDDLGGDFVIVRADGTPMYNFGVVVDDATMGITHVFRAQEHLMNTPRQVLIYQALGLEQPAFGHMPLILAADRSKLSKRHGAVAVSDYQKKGYLPSGMINYLAQLGWNDGTKQEIYQIEELVEAFSMERMSKVAAIFDKDKFKWVNGHHIRLLDDMTASLLIGKELVEGGVLREENEKTDDFVVKAALLLKGRIRVLGTAALELKSILAYDIHSVLKDERFSEIVEDGSLRETARCIVRAYERGHLDDLGREAGGVKELADRISEERGGIKKKKLMTSLRLCLTAGTAGPDMDLLFDLLRSVDDNVICDAPPLSRRIEMLKAAFG